MRQQRFKEIGIRPNFFVRPKLKYHLSEGGDNRGIIFYSYCLCRIESMYFLGNWHWKMHGSPQANFTMPLSNFYRWIKITCLKSTLTQPFIAFSNSFLALLTIHLLFPVQPLLILLASPFSCFANL